MKRTWIASLLCVALIGGCGGGSTHTTKTTAGTNTTATPPTASTTSSGSTTAPGDCNTLGINPIGMREGTCTHAGITWVIVNENHTLKLKTLWATLAGVKATNTLSGAAGAAPANGQFVVASVTLRNKLPAMQRFDAAGTQQAGLILDGTIFKEAVSAESQADTSSCLKLATAIASGQTVTCDVIFDVPAHAGNDLGKHGSGDLYLVNFGSDLAGGVLPQTIGQIRLYR